MKYSLVQISIFTGLFFSSIPQVALSQTNDYPLGYRAGLLSNCLHGTIKDITDKKQVYQYTKMCLCLVEKIQDKYTFSEHREIVESGQNEELREFAKKAVYDCI